MSEGVALLERPIKLSVSERLRTVDAAATPVVAERPQEVIDTEFAKIVGALAIDAEGLPAPEAFNLANDPEIAALQRKARREAEGIMQAHRASLSRGEFDSVPLEADAGGTARKLVAIGRDKRFGKNSPEYAQAFAALLRDSERRVAEACRAKTWELFDVTVYEQDAETGDFYSDGFNVTEIMRNGLTPATNPANPEEQPRRINEFVDSETDVALIARPDMHDKSSYVFSQCPDSLIERHKRGLGKRVYSDYDPETERCMIREKRFDVMSKKIYVQQMAVPGKYITNDVFNIALRLMRAADGSRTLDKTEVHSTQVIVGSKDVPDVVHMLKFLDAVASKYHGMEIFLGTPLRPGQQKDYGIVYSESARRRQEQAELTLHYSLRLIELEESGLDRELVNKEINAYLRNELLNIAERNPDAAGHMFNQETAVGFRLARDLELVGDIRRAQEMREQTRERAPEAGGCGAGSCGLRELNSSEEKQAEELLGKKLGEKSVKDDERPCRNCGQKAVVIDYDGKNVGGRVCLSCRATDKGSPKKDKPSSPKLSFAIKRPKTKQKVKIAA